MHNNLLLGLLVAAAIALIVALIIVLVRRKKCKSSCSSSCTSSSCTSACTSSSCTTICPCPCPPVTDPNAALFFAALKDMPVKYNSAYNDFIKGLKADQTWTKGIKGVTLAPSSDPALTLLNIFDPIETSIATLEGLTPATGEYAIPFTNGLVTDVAGDGAFVDLNLAPTTYPGGFTVIEILATELPDAATFDYGASQGAAQSQSTTWTNGAGQVDVQAYTTTSNFVAQVVDPTEFTIISTTNNVAGAYNELRRDNVLVSSNTTASAGTPPTIDMYWSAQNLSGVTTGQREKRSMGIFFFSPLTVAEIESVTKRIKKWLDDMKRPCRMSATVPRRQIIMSGSRLTRVNYMQFMRGIQLARPLDYEWYQNWGTWTQTLTQMVAALATNMQLSYTDATTKWGAGGVTPLPSIAVAWEWLEEVTGTAGSGTEAVDALALQATWSSTVSGYGYNSVAVATMIASLNPSGLTDLQWYTITDTINTGLLAAPATYGGHIINLTSPNLFSPRSAYPVGAGGDASFVAANDAIVANAVYFEANGIDLTQAGMDIVTGIASTVINTL